MMNENYFAARLSHLREQKGYTARDMSLSIGRSESYINKIENKRTKPSMDEFFVICDYLGVTPKDFFDMDSADPETLNELIKDLKALTPEQLSNIASIVRDLKK